MIDLHCHILPGVDDGSHSMQESLAMLKQAKASDIDHIICTPHCRSPWFDYKAMRQAYRELKPHAERMGIEFEMGWEVNWKKLSEVGLDKAPKLRLSDTEYFLLEFSDNALPAQWQGLIRSLQDKGLTIIIAHPERYQPVQRDLGVARQFKELGCYLQLSGNCLDGGRFDARRKAATAMLKEGLIDYVASDAHCPEDYAKFRKLVALARQIG